MSQDHYDIMIVGAGIAGLGSAVHVLHELPGRSFAILEERESFGGTWDTHRYPGVRCDADFSLYGYKFRPWLGKPIASGAEILDYLGKVIEENHLGPRIKFSHKVLSAKWSDRANRWTIRVLNLRSKKESELTANFLWMCPGYYRQNEGNTPAWKDMNKFTGKIVHPQKWPKDLDYKGKRVVVIGSGATAATLIPAMAMDCEHITMLQRSPSYFKVRPNVNEMAVSLRELKIDETWIHEIVRRKILSDMRKVINRSFAEPEVLKKQYIDEVRSHLPPGYDVEKHFTPKYRVWQQRSLIVPDGDFFKCIKAGKASVVTDEIDCFTETGVKLKSGQVLEADLIVTATGFHMNFMGDIPFEVNGKKVNFSEKVVFHSLMLNDVPNMVFVWGYIRTSWTLRVHMVAEFVCRLLKHMQSRGVDTVKVDFTEKDRNMKLGPFISPENVNSNYIQRAMNEYPKSGDRPNWESTQDYQKDVETLQALDLNDEVFIYGRSESNASKKAG